MQYFLFTAFLLVPLFQVEGALECSIDGYVLFENKGICYKEYPEGPLENGVNTCQADEASLGSLSQIKGIASQLTVTKTWLNYHYDNGKWKNLATDKPLKNQKMFDHIPDKDTNSGLAFYIKDFYISSRKEATFNVHVCAMDPSGRSLSRGGMTPPPPSGMTTPPPSGMTPPPPSGMTPPPPSGMTPPPPSGMTPPPPSGMTTPPPSGMTTPPESGECTHPYISLYPSSKRCFYVANVTVNSQQEAADFCANNGGSLPKFSDVTAEFLTHLADTPAEGLWMDVEYKEGQWVEFGTTNSYPDQALLNDFNEEGGIIVQRMTDGGAPENEVMPFVCIAKAEEDFPDPCTLSDVVDVPPSSKETFYMKENSCYSIKSHEDYGMSSYSKNTRRRWKLQQRGKACKNILFQCCPPFNVEGRSPKCKFGDKLVVQDMRGSTSIFCGTKAPKYMMSGKGTKLIQFLTGKYRNRKGFRCLLCTRDCS